VLELDKAMIHALAERLEATSFSQYMAESAWAFPTVETIHVLFLVLVVGSIFVVDFRLVGISPSHRSVRSLSREVLPVTWTGFAIAALSGFAMFASKATTYLDNKAFLIKLALLVLAGLNMIAFHFLTYRSVERWDVGVRPPLAARLAGGLSLLLWTAIIFAGRWVGFL
jgi:hypothetical protein